MLRVLASLSLTLVVAAPAGASQLDPPDSTVLASVRIPEPVLANGRRLPMGTYQVRLTGERPSPNPGQSSDAQRWVEFTAEGSVVGREIAEILRDDDRPEIGASSQRAAEGVRVQMLKGGDYLRISVKREAIRYLIHLPLVTPANLKTGVP